MVDVLLGLQWGDEGKGKIVDFLAPDYRMIARFQGGPNAGHTLVIGGEKMVLHTVPSGILRADIQNLIGNGVVIDPITLRREIEQLEARGVDVKSSLSIAMKAHLILPTHKILDAASEAAKGAEKIGSTLRGIGPTYMDKTGRNGLRVGDILQPGFSAHYQRIREKHFHLLNIYGSLKDELLAGFEAKEKEWFDSLDFLKHYRIVHSEYVVNETLKQGHRILAEGAQGTMLDIDFGTYPYVTSSNTITAGACNGLGIAPAKIREVIGIAKAYCTRVGSGPFPSELSDETGEKIRQIGGEFGATTGRARRTGWLDLVALNYAIMINGVTQIAMTKADVLNNFSEVKVCTAYKTGKAVTDQLPFDLCNSDAQPVYETFTGWGNLEQINDFDDLPNSLRSYLRFVEQQTGVPVTMLSTGPEREKLLVKSTDVLIA